MKRLIALFAGILAFLPVFPSSAVTLPTTVITFSPVAKTTYGSSDIQLQVSATAGLTTITSNLFTKLEITSVIVGVKVDVNQAMDFYYCAALEFMSADRNLEAEIILKSMNETTIPTDARIVDVYAKLNKNNR